jgi:hypothetical protein
MYKSILILFLAFLFIADIKLSFKPFSIMLINWRGAIGILMIMVGAAIYYNAGYRKGVNETVDKVIEIIDKEQDKPHAITDQL